MVPTHTLTGGHPSPSGMHPSSPRHMPQGQRRHSSVMLTALPEPLPRARATHTLSPPCAQSTLHAAGIHTSRVAHTGPSGTSPHPPVRAIAVHPPFPLGHIPPTHPIPSLSCNPGASPSYRPRPDLHPAPDAPPHHPRATSLHPPPHLAPPPSQEFTAASRRSPGQDRTPPRAPVAYFPTFSRNHQTYPNRGGIPGAGCAGLAP